MDKGKQELKGSPTRDMFKYLHKKLSKYLYACDVDFTLVAKCPGNRKKDHIVGILDYKEGYDSVTFSEAIAYNAFITAGFPVYIVRSTCTSPRQKLCTCECTCGADDIRYERMKSGKFRISEIKSCDSRPDPPDYECVHVTSTSSWEEFEEWEKELRDARFREVCEECGG